MAACSILAMSENEMTINRDIMVLANPEIALLPNWVIALVAAGGLAAVHCRRLLGFACHIHIRLS